MAATEEEGPTCDVWNAATCRGKWSFAPSGDGQTAIPGVRYSANLVRYMETTRKACPAYHSGYTYGYTTNGAFVRWPHPACAELAEMTQIANFLYTCDMRDTTPPAACDMVTRFVFDLYYCMLGTPTRAALVLIFAPARVSRVRHAMRDAVHAKLLDRLETLYDTLIWHL